MTTASEQLTTRRSVLAGLATTAAGAGGLMTATSTSVLAGGPGLATAWVTDNATRVRLIAGGFTSANGTPELYAGIEIELDPGWKTYWRNPGSSGVPPRFDFKRSNNLLAATPLFPAPSRFKDRDGDTIGYKSAVVFPVLITPLDRAMPIGLNVDLEYGVCKDVCIPVQPTLSLTIDPEAVTRPAGAALSRALGRLPTIPGQKGRPGDPSLNHVKVALQGSKPQIDIEAMFPGGARDCDAFVEAPDGLWVPLPKPVGEVTGGRGRFTVDLTDGADLTDLKGRTIRLTLVSSAGQSETYILLE